MHQYKRGQNKLKYIEFRNGVNANIQLRNKILKQLYERHVLRNSTENMGNAKKKANVKGIGRNTNNR